MHALKACGSSVASCGLRRSVGVAPRPGSSMVCAAMQAPQTSARHEPACAQSSVTAETTSTSYGAFVSSFALYLLSAAPALASGAESYNPFEGAASNSLYVTLALFLMSVPGIWSQIKRAPKANIKRKTFEVEGPKAPNAMPLDDRARQIFKYFKSYNYELKGTGEVIRFVGTYAADRGQAAALVFYTFCGLASIALVLSTVYPEPGSWWYALTLLSPLAGVYYFQKGERQEEVKVKMVSSDDEMTTDIIVEGDIEEINRMVKQLGLREKGMVYVKGILEGM